MAKAKKLPSGQWRTLIYDYTDSDKKRHYKSFTAESKKESEFLAAQFMLNKKNNHDNNFISLGTAIDKYIENRSSILSPGTIKEYKRSRKCDLGGLMNINLYDITQEMIQDEINKESKDHSPKTVRNMHGLLVAVLKENRPDFAIHTALPAKVRPKIYVPKDAEIKKLLKAVEGTDMEIPVLLAAFGPMRRGEICALDGKHITGNVVHVEYSIALDEHNNWVKKKTKSYAGDRLIDFPQFVINKLNGKTGNIVNLNPAMITNRFKNILKKENISHFRFHDLRHYCASIQHAIGIPDAYIMQRGGWGNDGVLKNVYRHVLEEKEAEMTNKANDYFEQLIK